MSVIELHTVPKDTLLNGSGTFLCVFDETDNLIADYTFCTGLRLLQVDDNWVIYINNDDLIAGAWTLFVDALDETVESQRVSGTKEGAPAYRVVPEFPWRECGGGARVSKFERGTRLSICRGCPLFDVTSMTCTASGKFVLDVTTRADEYCPQDLWGDKERILQAHIERAYDTGEATRPATNTTTITAEDQQAFESELDAFLEGM